MTTTRLPSDLEADETDVFDIVQRRVAGTAGRIGPCPDPWRLLDAYAHGLDDADREDLLSHAAACPMCQALVDAVVEPRVDDPDEAERRRLDARVAALIGPGSRRSRGRRFRSARWWGPALWAAAAGAVLAVNVGRQLEVPPPPVGPSGTMGRLESPAPTLLLAERLDTRGMGLASLSWRGDATSVPPSPDFDAARAAFDHGAFAEADQHLSVLTIATPSFGDAWLLLGTSRLLRGEAAEAVAPLTRAHETLEGDARADAAWHLAVALHATGRDAEARAVLDAMCVSGSARAPLACLALDELRGP
jgi:hypothetical protein